MVKARRLETNEEPGLELEATVSAFDSTTSDRGLSWFSLGPVSQAQGGHQTAHPAGLAGSDPHRHRDPRGKGPRCQPVGVSRHRARHLLGQGSGGSRLGSPLGRPSSLRLLGDSGPKQSPLSSLPLWTPGRFAPSSQRSDGTLGLAWIAARRSRTPAKRSLLRRCTPHISSLPHPQFYPSGPQCRLPLPTSFGRGSGSSRGEVSRLTAL